MRVATYRGTTVVISRGNCPTHEGSCAIGVMSLGVDVPRGSCPRGSRVAKFDSKVGSRRTTRIPKLVVLTILLVALILFSYHM